MKHTLGLTLHHTFLCWTCRQPFKPKLSHEHAPIYKDVVLKQLAEQGGVPKVCIQCDQEFAFGKSKRALRRYLKYIENFAQEVQQECADGK